MHILVVLRNIYNNPDLFDDEAYLSKSDCNILAEAMMLKEHIPCKVTALLFAENVPDNIQTLKKACTYGADEGYLIHFSQFDFSETESLAQVMAQTIQCYFSDYDLILFGRLAYDGDAINLATQVSCHLDIPRVVYSQALHVEDHQIYSTKYVSASEESVYLLKGKCLIQSIREKGVTRQPKIEDIIRTYQDVEIQLLDGDAIYSKLPSQRNPLHCIGKTEPSTDKADTMRFLNGSNDHASAANLLQILYEKGFQVKRND